MSAALLVILAMLRHRLTALPHWPWLVSAALVYALAGLTALLEVLDLGNGRIDIVHHGMDTVSIAALVVWRLKIVVQGWKWP